MSAGPLRAAIFDVDGVLLASPHERAWREALVGLADPARFTTAVYQAAVAGKLRMNGALAALQALGVTDAAGHVDAYVKRKQARLEELIAGGHVAAFPDALRFVAAVSALGWPMAMASSFKNANAMLRQIHLADGRNLLSVFKSSLRQRWGSLALATLPASRSMSAQMRSPAAPVGPISSWSRVSPSIDLTGYRLSCETTPTTVMLVLSHRTLVIQALQAPRILSL